MILHTVLFQPKDEISQEEIATMLQHVRELQRVIPGILDMQADLNLSTSNNLGYTYGFVMRFVDHEHLHAYAPHSAHKVVSNELAHISESIIDFDLKVA